MMPGRLMKCGVRSTMRRSMRRRSRYFLENFLGVPLGAHRGMLEREEALERELAVLHRMVGAQQAHEGWPSSFSR